MLMRFQDMPKTENCPPGITPGTENKIMHSRLRVGKSTLMMSDGRCQGQTKFAGISLSIEAPDVGAAEKLFAALADGGQVHMPLGKTFFSPAFGMVMDRFGVTWMLIVPG